MTSEKKREIVHVYRIYFPTSDKYYVGQTNNLWRRMRNHLSDGRGNIPVHNALLKYDDWDISILHTCQSRDEANRVEIEEIRNYNSIKPNGYNLVAGGGGCSGLNPSESARAKISAAGRARGIEWRAKTVSSMVGKTYGDLYIAEYLPGESTAKVDKYRCICTCGNEKNILGGNLRRGNSKSCGCLVRRGTVDKMVGMTFSRIHVIQYVPEASKEIDYYLCKCSCGSEKIISGASLRSGNTSSCGCAWREMMAGDKSPMRQPEIVARHQAFKKINYIKKLRSQIKELESNNE